MSDIKFKLYRMRIREFERMKFETKANDTHIIVLRATDSKGNRFDSPIFSINCSELKTHVKNIKRELERVIKEFHKSTK